MKNKKAEAIGATITSIFATFLLILILFTFLVISIVALKTSGGNKGIYFTGISSSKTVMANSLIAFLDTKVSDKVYNKDILIKYLDNPSEANKNSWDNLMNGYFNKINSECYIFRAGFLGETEKIIESSVDKAVSPITLTASGQANQNKELLFYDKLVHVFLIDSQNKLIEIKFFGGACQ